MVLLTHVLGLVIAGLAIGFGESTDKPASEVLFSGQSALGGLISNASDWSVGALLLLVACKALAYALSQRTTTSSGRHCDAGGDHRCSL
jgi:hypothetical protein